MLVPAHRDRGGAGSGVQRSGASLRQRARGPHSATSLCSSSGSAMAAVSWPTGWDSPDGVTMRRSVARMSSQPSRKPFPGRGSDVRFTSIARTRRRALEHQVDLGLRGGAVERRLPRVGRVGEHLFDREALPRMPAEGMAEERLEVGDVGQAVREAKYRGRRPSGIGRDASDCCRPMRPAGGPCRGRSARRGTSARCCPTPRGPPPVSRRSGRHLVRARASSTAGALVPRAGVARAAASRARDTWR